MKRCNKCNVLVDNPVEHCPLCYATLSQADSAPEAYTYPDLAAQAMRYNLLYRIMILLSVTACSVCLLINILVESTVWWSLIVVGNVLYMWVALTTAVRKRSKIGFNILMQVLSLAALMVLIDWFSGHSNWALNYVVPFLFITATLCITIIIIVKRLKARDFILYFFLTALMGFIPILLAAVRQVTVLWPSIVSAMYSGLSLISLFIFADNATKIELKKRFHI